jgi:dGTPase
MHKNEFIERCNKILTHPKATRYDQPPDVRKRRPEPLHPFKTVFDVDIERILCCKAFRRLKHKTQIIWAPRDAHFRTRMTHTLDVARVSELISRHLGLNPHLTCAIAYAHDIGHPPFGHAGERALKEYLKEKFNLDFDHHEQAVKILQEQEKLEVGPKDFVRGLNLTWQVEDGIRFCSTYSKQKPKTLEGQVVAIADDLTYVAYDYEELLVLKAIHSNKFIKLISSLGKTPEKRLDRAIEDVIKNSGEDRIEISIDLKNTIEEIKERESEIFRSEDLWARRELGAKLLINRLMDYLIYEPLDQIENAIKNTIAPKSEEITFIERIRAGEDRIEAVVNYIARMTDTFAIDLDRMLFSPEVLTYYF